MTAVEHHLDDTELARLLDLEAAIATGLQTFVAVGQALAEVRDSRLYRADHDTFENYCDERWGIARSRAYQLIEAADVVSTMVDNGLPAPANERQARALAAVPEHTRPDVWRRAVEETEGKPTAAAVGRAAMPEPTREERSATAVERWPELAFFHGRGEFDRVLANAKYLDSYAEPELTARRKALSATIAAEQRDEQKLRQETAPDYPALAREMFAAVNAAAQLVAKYDGASTLAAAGVDATTRKFWAESYIRFAEQLNDMAAACRPSIRRVK